MKTELKLTKDGSHTLYVPDLDEHYHSINGAITESNHIFLKHGLQTIEQSEINVFELGFGTGLNALLTLEFAENNNKFIYYKSIDTVALNSNIVDKLNYGQIINYNKLKELHSIEWDREKNIGKYFVLCKTFNDIIRHEFAERNFYDIVYFDAFGPDKQPELWSKAIFEKMNQILRKGGILTTYSTKGDVKRALKATGFTIEKLPGPPGKREILRATKS